ncbi:MAG: hypothetical protein COA96_13610 [SAR86 cluster bacterium]|uniref:AMP-dependent synthetase/ligase domain-containing protein n=1 Tax=SAR86 cluster bacterium TaxID=2030880 RepID=A0A2A5ATT6_9GAMM|nr:MAG: hypothetical protein COA96_13610 [SAR86 cluster bacterium]
MSEYQSTKSTIDAVPKPLVENSNGAALYGLLQQLNTSQFWTAEQLAKGQLQQLKNLLSYVILHSPYYKNQFSDLDVNSLDLALFTKLPVLSRSSLQANNDSIDCTVVPAAHGKVTESMTSGSTGAPVELRATGLTATIWNAINMREHIWHKRDATQTSASIRWSANQTGMAPEGTHFNDWGSPINQFYQTGRSHYLNSGSDISAQIKWLQQLQPSYLMTHPSNLRALIDESLRRDIELPPFKEVRCVGENVTAQLRQTVRSQLNSSLVDFYSSEETGYVALQCPLLDHYHVQSESVIVEIVRDDGSACNLHEPGRILITSLRNYATPLIRYEIGDYGEFGEPCDCGRGLPVLSRINGRVRNMLHLPSGNKSWPNFGFRKMMEITPLRQFQVVQHELEKIELKLVVDEKLSPQQEAQVKKILCDNLGYPFTVNISYHSFLARSSGGKFEDFISLIEHG